MSNIRNRFTKSSTAEAGNQNKKPKPLSTTKFKDKTSGLTYNYEDRLSKMKLVKTTILMLLLTLLIFYFGYNFYILFSNYLFDFYWHNIRGVTDASNPSFIRELWISNLIDLLVILLKMLIAFFLFRYLNSKLLLSYNDKDELQNYN